MRSGNSAIGAVFSKIRGVREFSIDVVLGGFDRFRSVYRVCAFGYDYGAVSNAIVDGDYIYVIGKSWGIHILNGAP